MKRYLLLLTASIAALAVVLPASAGAATFRGAVVAKDSARKALVTASKDGTVRTVRLHPNFNRFRVGSNVAVRGAKLPTGRSPRPPCAGSARRGAPTSAARSSVSWPGGS